MGCRPQWVGEDYRRIFRSSDENSEKGISLIIDTLASERSESERCLEMKNCNYCLTRSCLRIQMRPLSSDLREFIHLLNTNSVKFVIVGAWALALNCSSPPLALSLKPLTSRSSVGYHFQ
jgi:hypothetical protein